MQKTSLVFAIVLGLFVLLFCFGNIPAVKAQDTSSLEGEWMVQSSSNTDYIGGRYTIVREGDGYKVNFSPASGVVIPNGCFEGCPVPSLYYGTPAQIIATVTPSYYCLVHMKWNISDAIRSSLSRQLEGKFTLKRRFTLSSDGHSAEYDADFFDFSYDSKSYLVTNYNVSPFAYKTTLVRVAPAASEARSDHAYSANCGKVDPNRTTPITTDLCREGLACMTYFCGGGTGCPYVCCPKGLPYLNHCNCKCYATSDFDCHSYSKCQEQPRQ